MRRRVVWLLVVGVVLWVCTPLVALGVLVVRSGNLVAVQEELIWVPVEPSDPELSSQIGIAIEWATPPPLRAPMWSGIVQAVYVEPGDVLESGTPVVRIDGTDRLAIRSAMPFSRPLVAGASGDDVGMLHELLSGLGISNPGGQQFTSATGVAVAEFNALRGGDSRSRVFDPGSVIWLSEPMTVAWVDMHIGALAPGVGMVFLEGKPVIDHAFTIDAIDVATVLRLDPGVPVSTVVSAVTPRAGSRIQLDEVTLAMVTDTGEISPASVTSLASKAPTGSRAMTARMFRQSEGEWLIPAAAVFAAIDNGRLCVLVQDATSVKAVRVLIESRSEGRAVVSGDLDVTMKVALGAQAEHSTCN